MNNNMEHGNYIVKDTDGKTKLGYEKSGVIASICDEQTEVLPKFELIPHGLILVCVAFNKRNGEDPEDHDFEAAIICDTKTAWRRVNKRIQGGAEKRPLQFFLVKREFVRQMAAHHLESD